ncbi:MAG: Hint domain-containing protein, partial [Alphaproteobacteria bacterium]
MGQPPLSDELAQQAIDAVAQAGWNITKASIALDIPRQTLESRYNTAKRRKLKARVRVRATSEPTVATPTVPSGDASADLEVRRLRSTIETLRADLKAQRRAELDHHIVREQILGLTAETPTPPEWVLNAHEADEGPGVPMTLWSDWHWGEVVRAEEVGGVNEFNIEIAHARARRLVEKIISLSFSHAVNPTYPGIVVMLGGDMISGEIHDEITETNEMRTAPALIDLQGVLIEALTHMADRFGRVFVPCVVGNHGRMTHKPRAKGRVHCLDVATPILTRDLNWVAAGDLAEGQGLLAFDDEAPPTQRQGRSLQSAAVTRNARVVAPTLRIELANGDVLFATHEHKFLARTGANVSHRWISAEQMSRRYTENNSEGGRPVKYYLPRYMRTWERVDTYEAGYLAGAFDADGCLQTVNGSGL